MSFLFESGLSGDRIFPVGRFWMLTSATGSACMSVAVRHARFFVVMLFLFGLACRVQADQLPDYLYTFTLPALDANGNPNGGTFTDTFSVGPGPLRNTVQECSQGPAFCPQFNIPNGFVQNIDPFPHSFAFLDGGSFADYGGATVELDFGGGVAFGFAASDDFWRGLGGAFASSLSEPPFVDGPFARYIAQDTDHPCDGCSVQIT